MDDSIIIVMNNGIVLDVYSPDYHEVMVVRYKDWQLKDITLQHSLSNDLLEEDVKADLKSQIPGIEGA